MDTIILISILVFLVVMLIVLLWFAKKNQNENYDLSEDINREIEALDKELKDLNDKIASNNNLLETYNKEKIILTGDLFHNEAQINEQYWCPIFDWNTIMSTISRVGLLNSAYKNQWIICTGHLADDKAIGRIKKNKDGFYWDPI